MMAVVVVSWCRHCCCIVAFRLSLVGVGCCRYGCIGAVCNNLVCCACLLNCGLRVVWCVML